MTHPPLFLLRAIFVVVTAASSCLAATASHAADPETPSSQIQKRSPLGTEYYQRVAIEDVKSLVGFLRTGGRSSRYVVKLIFIADGKFCSLSGRTVNASPESFDLTRFVPADKSTLEKLDVIYGATEELKTTPSRERSTDVTTLVRVIAEIERFVEERAEPPTTEQRKQEEAIVQAARSVASDPDRVQTLDHAIGEIKELAYDMWEFRSTFGSYKIPAKVITADDEGRVVERKNAKPAFIISGGIQCEILGGERIRTPSVSQQEWQRHNEKYSLSSRVARPGDPGFATRGTSGGDFAGKYIDLAIRDKPPFYSFQVRNPCPGCYFVRIAIDDELTVLGGGRRVRAFTVTAYGPGDQPIDRRDTVARGYFALDENGEFSHVQVGRRKYPITPE